MQNLLTSTITKKRQKVFKSIEDFIQQKETFRGLAEELAGEEPWPDIEDIISFTPSPQRDDPEPQAKPQQQQQDTTGAD